MSKYQYSNKTIYYQKARFFKKADTNEFAYCIEPFSFFNENETYTSTINPYNLTNEQKNRIEKIAHFGYGYRNHTNNKWYAITQMMIWKEADPSSGEYYFTDTLNGNKIYPYENEMNEINNLINNYDTLPEINNKTYNIVEGQFFFKESDNITNYYSSDDNRVKISYGNIKIENLKEGEYSFTLYRNESNYNKPIIFYQSYNSQNLLTTGDIENKHVKFKVKVHKTKIKVNKLDYDTKEKKPQGEAILDNIELNVLDKMKHIVGKITVSNYEGYIENLPFGTYYLKETNSNEGYKLNEELYEVNLSLTNLTPEVNIYNKVIEKNIIIKKQYGEEEKLLPEKNIDFEIYNKDSKLIKTISTDENGLVKTILPYGKYTIKQKNTTSGYQKNKPFNINVEDEEEITIELIDYKIPVPNTSTNKNSNILYIILIILLL